MNLERWNPTNPEWWRAQIEARSADVIPEWLANEYKETVQSMTTELDQAIARNAARRDVRARLLAARLPVIITRHFVGWRLRSYEHDEWDQIAAEIVDAVVEADGVANRSA